ncbi:hypothetical protein ACFYKX_11870 [Cytobacillus sp. FJAT-54145]|uniref:Lipoprotein n=1 Tax=Cytobacillus spartinae TaxID=3299023 RepID=A0ABW6KCI0_9BACI
MKKWWIAPALVSVLLLGGCANEDEYWQETKRTVETITLGTATFHQELAQSDSYVTTLALISLEAGELNRNIAKLKNMEVPNKMESFHRRLISSYESLSLYYEDVLLLSPTTKEEATPEQLKILKTKLKDYPNVLKIHFEELEALEFERERLQKGE